MSEIADVAAALADRTRARMLEELLGGPPLSAGALAVRVGVAPSTVCGHLRKLEQAGLMTIERHGRRREAQLAGPHVAEALEALAGSRATTASRSGCRRSTRSRRCARRARVTTTSRAGRASRSPTSCSSTARSIGATARSPSRRARATSSTASASTPAQLPTRRPLVRACVDWTERRPHVAGALGAALLDAMLDEAGSSAAPTTAR